MLCSEETWGAGVAPVFIWHPHIRTLCCYLPPHPKHFYNFSLKPTAFVTLAKHTFPTILPG